MRMNFGEKFEIRDLGNHCPAMVIRLALLLAGTVSAMPDPKRKHFYEIEGGSTLYYVYWSPYSRIIFLIAACKKMIPIVPQFDLSLTARPAFEIQAGT